MAGPIELSTRELLAFGLGVLVTLAALSQGPLHARVVPSDSMAPTLQTGDRLLVIAQHSKQAIRRGALVVFRPPFRALPGSPPSAPAWLPWADDSIYVKRIVAMPGDHVRVIAHQGVFIDGQRLHEPYVLTPPAYDWGPHQVPAGHVVVLGDNRNDSFDSHHWGFLPLERVVGRPAVRLWPPARWTTF